MTKSDKSFFYPVLREGLADYTDGSVFGIEIANRQIVDESNDFEEYAASLSDTPLKDALLNELRDSAPAIVSHSCRAY